MYEVVSKIFQTDAVKIVKLTIRLISFCHPRSSSLLHVDTGPTVFSIFGTLPGSPFLSECQALSAILPVSQWYQTGVLSTSVSFLERGRSHRVPNQGNKVGGGWQPFCFSPKTAGWGRKYETGRCHGEADRSALAKVWGDVFTCFHTFATKCRSRTQNSQFGLLGQILCAQSPWHQRKWWSCSWHCFSPVWPFLAVVTWGFSTGRFVALSQGRNRKPSSHHKWWPWTRRFHHQRRADEVQCRRWRAAASGQWSGSWAQIWLRHGACPILPSEPVGTSHNQFPPPQQCREWSNVDPDGQALEFVQQFQVLCSFWVSLCVHHR